MDIILSHIDEDEARLTLRYSGGRLQLNGYGSKLGAPAAYDAAQAELAGHFGITTFKLPKLPRDTVAETRKRLVQTSSNVLLGVNAHLVLALGQLQAGDPAQARRRILENAGGPDLPLAEAVMRPHWHGVLAQAELSLARREAAEDWTRRAETSAQGLQLPSATAHAELARATLLLADGDPDNACALALRAGQRLRSIGGRRRRTQRRARRPRPRPRGAPD